MAKISAHGAREVDRIITPHGLYLLTTDNRILAKTTVRGDGWRLIMKGKNAPAWFRGLRRAATAQTA